MKSFIKLIIILFTCITINSCTNANANPPQNETVRWQYCGSPSPNTKVYFTCSHGRFVWVAVNGSNVSITSVE